MSPKRVEDVAVTVPPSALYSAPEASSASVSQLQATSGRSGSWAISVSSSQVANTTIRSEPPQASTPSGSNNRIIRPDAVSSSLPAGYRVAERAWLHGASRVGGGNGPISTSV